MLLCTRRLPQCYGRSYSTLGHDPAKVVVNVPAGAQIYRFGDVGSNATPALHLKKGKGWQIREGETWAVIGTGGGSGKTTLFKTLLGQLRISPIPPPPHGLYPFLATRSLDPYQFVSLLSFAHRARGGSEFYDFSARYGAVREEDRITLRQTMKLPGPNEPMSPDDERELELLDKLGLTSLLDLPAIALSNGQTRKARIVKAVCRQPRPELLLMDEPLTGVDASTRPTLTSLLETFHTRAAPRLLLGLRAHDPIPDWVSHVAVVGDGHGARVQTGRKGDVPVESSSSTTVSFVSSSSSSSPDSNASSSPSRKKEEEAGEPLAELNDVGVKYGDRQVLSSITWKIHPGSRWHLRGSNGSGKTTLLSLLTGDHPQSYSLRAKLLLFGKPRYQTATVELTTKVGLASTDVFDSFPRRSGVSVEDVIRMGFTGTYFLQRRRSSSGEDVDDEARAKWKWEDERLEHIVSHLGPSRWDLTPSLVPATVEFLKRDFVNLPQSEQYMVLLMRALVGRPPLVILDEVWAGMSEGMVRATKAYLTSEEGLGRDQAAVVVSHLVEEVPWGSEEGLRMFSLDNGEGKEVQI